MEESKTAEIKKKKKNPNNSKQTLHNYRHGFSIYRGTSTIVNIPISRQNYAEAQNYPLCT